MTEKDETGADVAEFVAVTPIGTTPESHAAEPPAAEPHAAEPEAGEPEASEPHAEPEVSEPAAPEPPAQAEPAPAAEAAEVTDPDARPSVPSLEDAGAQPPTGPEAKLPVPGPTDEGKPAVSVRVAAEGMAAALAGQAPLAGPAEAEEGGRERSTSPVAVATALCVVLALAAATVLAIAARRDSHERAIAQARAARGTAATSALVAAKAETAAALTYDYRSLEADFQRAEAGMSRKFRANYAQTAATSVTPLAQKTHAVTTGTVAAAGVVSATPTTARILVFADQTVENKLLNATSRLDRSVIEVTMVKENGRWVIDNLQPF